MSQEVIDEGKNRHAHHHTSNDEEKSIKSLLKQDLDGMYFIDYFGVSPGEFDAGWDGLVSHLAALRELIKRLSQLTRNPSIKLKHSWLRQKFNETAYALEKNWANLLKEGRSVHELDPLPSSIAPFK